MKKAIIFLCCIALMLTYALPFTAGASYNSEINFDSDIVLLVSLDNGTVIFDKNPDTKTAPAALSAIVTAMVAIENCEDLDTVIPASYTAVHAIDGTGASTAGIVVGETLTLRQLLYCALLYSAADASCVIAEYIGGSIPEFVKKMNDFAAKLGCTGTNFTNPHGLDEDNNYTTANDMAKIAKYAYSVSSFMEIVNTVQYIIEPTSYYKSRRYVNNANLLINSGSGYYYKYASGIKTGATNASGRCVISTASKDGYNYLAVVMKGKYIDTTGDGEKDNSALIDCKKAFKWVFENIKLKTIADANQIVTVVNVKLSSETDHVRLVPKETITALVPAGADADSVLIRPVAGKLGDSINAPVKKGETVVMGEVVYADQVIANVELVAAESVSRSTPKFIKDVFSKIFHSIVFKIIFIIALIAIAFYVAVNIIYNKKKKNKKIHMVQNYRDLK